MQGRIAKTCAAFAAVACLMLLSATASADTYLVRANGSGDFPTIQAALDGTVSGDIIELAYGKYDGAGNGDLDFGGKAVTIRSQSGNPEDVEIDAEGNEFDPHRAFIFNSGEGPGSIVQDVTITNGYTTGHGGAVYSTGSSPTFNGCVFGSNKADGSESFGGAVYCTGASSPTFTGCYFLGNTASEFGNGRGGAIACFMGANATISDCHFEGNYAEYRGGAIFIDQCDATITDCVVETNGADGGAGIYLRYGTFTMTGCEVLWNETWAGSGGGLLSYQSDLNITNCTFMGNMALAGGGMYVDCENFTLTRTIVAYSLGGGGVWYGYEPYRAVSIACCDVFENTGGNYGGQIGDQTGINDNISEDPLFCDAPAGDMSIDADSPCAPANSLCGQLIGAQGVDCGTPVEKTSWGSIKAKFE